MGQIIMAEPAAGESVTMSGPLSALKSARSIRFAKWLLASLLVFAGLGFLAAPMLLKSILPNQLSQVLHRQVTIQQIEINPFALSARVAGATVMADGGKEVAGFDELFVNLSSASVFKLAVVVDEIRVQGLRLAVSRVADGRYDISDLLDEWMQPTDEPESEMPRFSLNNIQLLGGQLVFDDLPAGKTHTVSDIALTLPFVSSLPYQAEILVKPAFSAKINGAELALTGDSKPFSETRESRLNLDLDQFDLAGLQPYLPDSLPFRLKGGSLDSELKAMFAEASDGIYSITVAGALHVSGLAVSDAGGQPLLGWKRLDIDIEMADPLNRKVAIGRIALDGPEVGLAVNSRGEFNVLQLVEKMTAPAPKSGVQSPDKKPEAAKPFEWSLGEFALTDGLLRWRDESNPTPVIGAVRKLQVRVGQVDGKLVKPIAIDEISYQIDLGERFRVERMAIKGVRVDLPAHRIDIAEVVNSGARASMLRNKAGAIEWVSSPALKTIRATDAKAKDEKPWIGKLGKLTVEDLGFRFEDQTTQPVAVQVLEGFGLTAEGLTNAAKQKGKVSLKTTINKSGSLSIAGNLQIYPLEAALDIETRAISLVPLEPYLGQFLNISLTRGQVSNLGTATVKLEESGVKAAYKGNFTLGNFVAVDKINSADFLKWKSLYFGGIDFRLDPMNINVGEIALSDYYSRLILSKEGRLNLADIVKTSASETVAAADGKEKGGKAAKEPSGKPLPLRIDKVTLQNGTVNFSDFFVQPNYTVNLTGLGGRISGLSSADDTVADLDLRGKYANSAPVQIQAKLNPLAAKTYLDLTADVKGVDLVGFSPYSGKYAGYAIDKGKLSLNVAYKLENRKLSAQNRLFLDQFTFGDKVESPDATQLPVNLAISLLRNNRGEIDLNLPIAGSLDDPEFSLGGLIIKVIVNLFVKAVTSPFALIGSMFGGGDELSSVAFDAGRATIREAAGKKLEVLAKALNERNSLKLEITGRADPEIDKEGVKRAALERAMKIEKMKDMKKKSEGDSLDNIEIAPGEYKLYLTRAYKESKFPKPRNVIGFLKDLPVDEMERLMLTNQSVTDDDIRALAERRAEVVQGWLVDQGKVPVERLFLLPPKVDAAAKASRVDFSLR
jgi:hypothetical protein